MLQMMMSSHVVFESPEELIARADCSIQLYLEHLGPVTLQDIRVPAISMVCLSLFFTRVCTILLYFLLHNAHYAHTSTRTLLINFAVDNMCTGFIVKLLILCTQQYILSVHPHCSHNDKTLLYPQAQIQLR